MGEAMKLLRGTLDGLILRALAPGALHGYGVADWLRRTTDEVLVIEDGALYTALHRMEDRGWLEAEWGRTEEGHRAKFYGLTAEGRRQLERERSQWERYAAAVAKVFAADRGSG